MNENTPNHQLKQIQWFPGHMAKTRRLIEENLGSVDLVVELLDARIPASSRNPEIERLCGGKPRLTVLNKCGLADPAMNAAWVNYLNTHGRAVLLDCVSGQGFSGVEPAIREVCEDKLNRYREKGMAGRKVRAMVVGIPNVGKSSFINRAAGGRKARVEDRPGVTLTKQWVTTTLGFDLLDMPGVLWPKFEDEEVGLSLAMTGAIKDDILDIEYIAVRLCERLRDLYPARLVERYKLDASSIPGMAGHELFEAIARKRGHIVSGGEINGQRCSIMLLDELRGGKLGKITLEKPPVVISL